ncbi:YhgE/Pip family protein [Cellulomonas gilvus]|uniref:YhgE/Pip C-terminal domain protein n=1 Tax=Cellulomonas gilvus (strain ATCC 13127 / NRRL B-14078) TaxID=593907 RepID=F8A311_CELGA|nr:YhgE/Pip domain-containing protein [Cellulomonas gilvus]AEI11866.1 YhgE/Pip C-terminal domain protein [Cellulomonas gilvus ATCC 13127]
MPALTSTGTELRRFRRGRLPRLAVAAMILVPLLYGALYLWAFWDPTGNLDRLPVALVNADQGATLDGERLEAGADVTQRLTDSADLDWRVTSAQDAADGVADGTYYFAVTVPADFSADIASAGGEHPTAAQLEVTYDDANSFLASTLGRSAMVQVEAAVSASVGEQAVDRVLVGLGDARDGFAQASDGALTLRTAAGDLTDGASRVADGADDAADGATRLADGAGSAASGAVKVADGAHALADGAGTAATGAGSAAAGAATLADGLDTLRTGSGKVATGASALDDGATRLATGADSLADGLRRAAAGADQVDTGAARVAAGLSSASTGAARLQDGVQQVAQGVTTLHDELTPLVSAVPTLRSGLGQVSAYLTARAQSGDTTAAQLLQGLGSAAGSLPSDADLGRLADGLTALDSGAGTAASGAADLATGLSTLQQGGSSLAEGAHGVATGLDTLSTGADTLATAAGTLADGTADLASGADRVATGTAKAATGAGTLAAGTTTLADGLHALATGSDDLETGASALATGTGTLADGAGELANGTATLADGAHQVADGAGKITDGAGTLADGLSDGTDAIPADVASPERATTIASPVGLDETHVTQAEGFGEGFAPFFVPLALFVGSLITWLLLRPLPTRALATPASGWRATLAGYLPALLLGVAQVAVMLAVIHYGVGLQMSSVLGTVGFTLLVAATFLALQQMLMAVLGPAAGKVAVLALLMLQLASSGGTYPVETTPAFFRVIHPLLPMSYAVSGLRQVITGTGDARLWLSVAVLAAVLVGSLAVTAWRAGRMRTWTLERLHPALSL